MRVFVVSLINKELIFKVKIGGREEVRVKNCRL